MEQNLTTPETPGKPIESVSAIVHRLASGPEPSVAFRDVIAAAGSRVHGIAILLFVLPETLPLPLPSASGILGVPLLLISAHLAIFGEAARLPARVLEIRIPRSVFATIDRYAGPLLRWLERISRARLTVLAREERAVGLLCFYLSLILFLPIPLMNAAPAICLAALALGLIHRDGLFVAVGAAGATIITAVLFFVAEWVTRLAGWLVATLIPH